MPPRKSNVSTVSAAGDEGALGTGAGPSTPADGKSKDKETSKKDKDKDELAIEELTMPRAMVSRLARGVLPPNNQIQKDALTALCKSATVFINHIGAQAQIHTSATSRKTVNPNDVLAALRDTEYEFMIPRLEAELAKYNEIQTSKRNEYRKKTSARKSEGGEGDNVDQDKGAKTPGEGRPAKRAKGDGGEVIEGDTMEDPDVDMEGQEEEDQEEDVEEEEEEEEDGDETEGEDQDAIEEDQLEEKPSQGPGDGSDEDSD